MEWKWTKGEPYEKTKRVYRDTQRYNSNKEQNQEVYGSQTFIKDLESSAYTSSLNYDENTWSILNETVATNGFKSSNKREDLDLKMSDREMVQQIGANPFLSDTNYSDNISIRDQYLKPMNTTDGRVKGINEN
jgi:hypothetical protein